MVNVVNVLVIEDSEADYDLILHYLHDLDFEVCCERIETASSMKAALEKQIWDVIISDHFLPSFSATAALEIIQGLNLDIPFIIVSGIITEDIAIGLMRSGVSDYLYKDKLARLGPVVKRELKFAQTRSERRKTQKALQKAQDWSDLIYNTTSDLMFLLEVEPDNHYRYLSVNHAYLTLTGLRKEQVIGKRVEELFPAQYPQNLFMKYQEAFQVGHAIQFEENLDFPSGMVVVETTLTPVFDSNNNPNQLLVSSHNITKRKRAEVLLSESEERFRQIVECSHDVFFRKNIQTGRLEYISPNASQVLGYSPKELTALDIDDQLKEIHPDDLPTLININKELIEADEKKMGGIEREFRVLNKQEGYQWLHGKFSLVRDQRDHLHLIVGSISDINERKNSEEKLRYSEESFRLLAEHLQVGIIIYACDTSVLFSNSEAQRIFGLSAEEMNGKQSSDPIWHLFDKNGNILADNELPVNQIITKNTTLLQNVYGIYRPRSDDQIWAIVNGYPVFDDNQRLHQVVVSFADITSLKKTEDSLRLSELHYRSLFNYSSIAIWEMDFSEVHEYLNYLRESGVSDFHKYLEENPDEVGRCAARVKNLVVNPKSIALLGAKNLEEIHNKTADCITEDTVSVFKNILILLSEGHYSIEFEIPLRSFNGDDILLECNLLVSPECLDTFSRVLVYFIDITQRRQAEKALKENNDKLELLFDIVPVGLSVLNQNRELVKFNHAYEEIVGMPSEDIMRDFYQNRRFFRPDGTQMPPKELASSRVINGEKRVLHVETGVENENGAVIWADVSAVAPDLQDWSTVIVTADITRLFETQKRNQALLEELNQRNLEQEKIIKLTFQLRNALDMDEVQIILVEQALELFSVDAAALFLISNNSFQVSACSGRWKSYNGIIHPKGNTILNKILNSNQPCFLDSTDVMNEMSRFNDFKGNRLTELSSYALIPVFFGNISIGLLILGRENGGTTFESQSNLLMACAEIAGITLHSMKTTKLTQQLVSRRTNELSALYKVIATAGQSLVLTEKLEGALNETLRSLNCSYGGIFFNDREKNRVVSVASQNLPLELHEYIENAPREASCEGWVIKHEEILLISDFVNDPRFIGTYHEYNSQKIVYLGVPIINNEKTIGVLSILRMGNHIFSDDEISFICALADHIGVIIENNRLIEKIEKAALIEERSRLARDLHDSVTQTIYSSAFFAETGIKMIDQGKPDRAKEYFIQLSKITQQALKEMRLLIYQLRPEILTTEGLIPALRQRLELVENKVSIKTQLTVNEIQRLNKDVEDALYWTTVEALNNILKHAQASEIKLQIQIETCQVILTIQDDGQGFDIPDTVSLSGSGLINIQERLSRVGGSVKFSSKKNEGTLITIICPLETVALS